MTCSPRSKPREAAFPHLDRQEFRLELASLIEHAGFLLRECLALMKFTEALSGLDMEDLAIWIGFVSDCFKRSICVPLPQPERPTEA